MVIRSSPPIVSFVETHVMVMERMVLDDKMHALRRISSSSVANESHPGDSRVGRNNYFVPSSEVSWSIPCQLFSNVKNKLCDFSEISGCFFEQHAQASFSMRQGFWI